MNQLTIHDAITQGTAAMQACTVKAESFGFCTDAARAFVLGYLQAYGPSWGEDIVEAAANTRRPDLAVHDGRSWGSVFSTLAKRNRIHCLRADGIRRHGRGTAGARQWALVQRRRLS